MIIGNIGQVGNALEEGRTAYTNVNFGADIPSVIDNLDYAISDWSGHPGEEKNFIFGFHTWASTTKRVIE